MSRSFEVLVPGFLTVHQATDLFRKVACDMSDHLYHSSGAEFLCAVSQNALLDENCTLDEYDLKNGDHILML